MDISILEKERKIVRKLFMNCKSSLKTILVFATKYFSALNFQKDDGNCVFCASMTSGSFSWQKSINSVSAETAATVSTAQLSRVEILLRLCFRL
jgi:hypothetical protein